MQLTHSLKALWFQPLNLKNVISRWFKRFALSNGSTCVLLQQGALNYTWPGTPEQLALVAASTAEVAGLMTAAFRRSYPRHALPSEYINGTVKPAGMTGVQYGYAPDPAGMFLAQARLAIVAAGPLAGAARLLANGTITTPEEWARLVNLTALLTSNFTIPKGAEFIVNFTRDNLVLAPPAPVPPVTEKKAIWWVVIDFFLSINPIIYAIFVPIIAVLCCCMVVLRTRVAMALYKAKQLAEKLEDIDPDGKGGAGGKSGKGGAAGGGDGEGGKNPFEVGLCTS
jgi:hypothetical protein